MQGQEYLNQISASNRPTSKSKVSGILSSKYFLFGAGFVLLLIIIIIFGSLLSGGKGDEKSNSIKLDLHISGTIEVINEYQKDIKSSTLRGNSSSLGSVLSTTKSNLDNFFTEKYKIKDVVKEADKNYIAEASTARDGLISELFDAKITGNLDRVYAQKMAYEIALIASEEKTLMNQTKNETLKAILDESYKSLNNLYDDFNNFSGTK